MKTENDIRAFMQKNKMAVPGEVSFMADLVRQIDLLPVPAAFDKETGPEQRKMEEMDAVFMIFSSMRKLRMRKTAKAVAMAVLGSLAVTACVGLMPDSLFAGIGEQFSMSPVIFRYFLSGFMSLGVAMLASRSIVSA